MRRASDGIIAGEALIPIEGQLGAYRTVTKEAAAKRRRAGLSDTQAKDLMPDEWFEMWWTANMASDPVGAAQNPL
jgi:hypothetical protein